MRACKLFALMFFFGLLLTVASGCGKKVSQVKGKATFKDKPLVVGSVTLMGDNGVPFQGQIQPDGTFQIDAVPQGIYRIAVSSPDPNPPAAPVANKDSKTDQNKASKADQNTDQNKDSKTDRPKPKREPPAGWVPIPKRYGQHDQSGLLITVEGPEVIYDIKLKD